MKRLLRVIVLISVLALALISIIDEAWSQAIPQDMPEQGSPAAGDTGSHAFRGLHIQGGTVAWNAGTAARYLMVFDATSAPANGATTSCTTTLMNGCLAYCTYLTESTVAPNRVPWQITLPIKVQFGVVVALSTGAGCGTFTIDGGTDWFYSQVW